MIRLEYRLKKEKAILDKMIQDNNFQLSSDLIIKQSRKVDKLIVAYQKEHKDCIKKYNFNFKIRLVKSNV